MTFSLAFILSLICLIVPPDIWAQAVAVSSAAAQGAAPGGAWANIGALLDKLIALLNNPILGKIVAIVIGLLGATKWMKNQAIQKWAELAFYTVEEMARTNPGNEKLDKVALFTETFRAYMKRAGWYVLMQDDVEQAHAIAKNVNVLYSQGRDLVQETKNKSAGPKVEG